MKESILHIIDTNSLGGAEIMLLQNLRLLDQYEQEVFILSYKENGIFPLGKYKIHKGNFNSFLDAFAAINQLKRVLSQKNYRCIHFHSPLSTGLFIRFIKKTNLLVQIHNQLSKTAFGKNKVLKFLYNLFLPSNKMHIAVSNAVALDYKAWVGKIQKIQIVYNSVNEDFYNQTPKKSKDLKHFVCVASFKRQKNIFFLCKTFALLKNYRLTIVGHGDERFNIQAFINDKKLKNIHLKIAQKITPDFYKNFDAFILLSSYEGFGNVVIEAGLSGLPLFLSNIPIFKEITAGNANFLPLDNEDKTAHLLQEILLNEALIKKKSEAFYELAQKQFHYKNRLREIKNIYDSF